jgi:hypothetical protein
MCSNGVSFCGDPVRDANHVTCGAGLHHARPEGETRDAVVRIVCETERMLLRRFTRATWLTCTSWTVTRR